jgi:cell division protein FtsW (lipid II flippase)
MRSKILYWAPRILSILFVGFLCLFSFDGIKEYGGLATLLSLFMHLLIPLAVLIATIIAWKKDLAGTTIFFFFAVYYVYMVGLGRDWSWYASISGPALLIGVLYLLNWLDKKKSPKGEF